LTDDGRRHGISRVFLSQTRDALQFQVPAGFHLVSLFLDEHPLAMPVPSDGSLRIPLVGVARESILVMTWEQMQSQSQGPMQIQNDQLPWPSNIEVTRALLTCVPNRQELAVVRDGQLKLDWIDAALDRLEMLLTRQDSLGNDPRAATGNRALIDDLQKQITTHLSKGIAKPSAAVIAQLERWNRAVDAINHLDPLPSPLTRPGRGLRSVQVEEPFVDLPAVRVAVSSDDHSVSFWLFDRRWLDAISALVITLIAIPLFRRLIRLEWGEWLNAHTTVAWLILGLVWWMWLTPGILGPLIITVTICRSITQRRQARNSVMVVD
jgi:hypothetical protein